MLLGRWFKGQVSNKVDGNSKDGEGRWTIICMGRLEDRLSSGTKDCFTFYLVSVTIDKQANSVDFEWNGLDHALFIRRGP
jgi:hypothetical protein